VTYEQIDSMRLSGESISPELSIASLSLEEGEICINGLIPLRLAGCSHSISTADDIPVEDSSGVTLGALCKRAGTSVDPSAFTLSQYAAYLLDTKSSGTAGLYRFEYDYVVLRKEHLKMYLEKMKHSAPIWGAFVHADRQAALPQSAAVAVTCIVAVPTICLPTPTHERLAMRSVVSATPSERFLQLYHQLELLFDWVIVQEIKQLSDDLEGVGKVFSSYGSGDQQRLVSLLQGYLVSIDSLVNEHASLASYQSQAHTIFQDYSKEGNPLKEGLWNEWIKCITSGKPSEVNVKKFKALKAHDAATHRNLIVKLTAYFIYRVRCSVAHSKIGEYVLRDTDEEFVVRFAEPLIRAVLKELMSNPKLLAQVGGRLAPAI